MHAFLHRYQKYPQIISLYDVVVLNSQRRGGNKQKICEIATGVENKIDLFLGQVNGKAF